MQKLICSPIKGTFQTSVYHRLQYITYSLLQGLKATFNKWVDTLALTLCLTSFGRWHYFAPVNNDIQKGYRNYIWLHWDSVSLSVCPSSINQVSVCVCVCVCVWERELDFHKHTTRYFTLPASCKCETLGCMHCRYASLPCRSFTCGIKGAKGGVKVISSDQKLLSISRLISVLIN